MTISASQGIEADAPYLLKLFEAQVERELVKAAMDKIEQAHQQALAEIKPSIEQAAKAAVKGMAPVLQSRYRVLENDLVVAFIGKLPTGELTTDTPGVLSGDKPGSVREVSRIP